MVFFELIRPRVLPLGGKRSPEQVDRVLDLSGDLTLTQTKLYEMGRVGLLGVRKETPSLSYSLRQYEYGSMAFWYALANKETPSGNEPHYIDLDSIKGTMVDMTAYYTDDDKVTFRGTAWFPKLRVNGFTIDIGDPDAAVERSFDLVGEDFKILPNTYFSYASATATQSGDLEIALDPEPVEYGENLYIFRVIRIRGGEVFYLTPGDWTYDEGTKKVTIKNCQNGDMIKVYYPSDESEFEWIDNNTDPEVLYAADCEIYMKVGVGEEGRIYRLQSVGIDVSFDRTDYKEIGNPEVVQTGVTAKTVTVSLDRFNEGFSLEQLLVDETYPYNKNVYIDTRELSSKVQLLIKVYKYVNGVRTFGIGYLATKLSPTSLAVSQAVEEYGRITNALEGDFLKISDKESELEFD